MDNGYADMELVICIMDMKYTTYFTDATGASHTSLQIIKLMSTYRFTFSVTLEIEYLYAYNSIITTIKNQKSLY